MSETQRIIRVNYYEGENPRFIKGLLKNETDEFIELELRNYITKIFKKYIIKIEVEKPRGGCSSG